MYTLKPGPNVHFSFKILSLTRLLATRVGGGKGKRVAFLWWCLSSEVGGRVEGALWFGTGNRHS